MKALATTELYKTLKRNINDSHPAQDVNEEQLWDEFTHTLYGISSKDTSEYEVLRTLNYGRCEFSELVTIARENEDKQALRLSEKALMAINDEIELRMTAVKHPLIWHPVRPYFSPLFLADGYTQTDLVELISGIHTAKMARLDNGSPATLNDIIPGFEFLFNEHIEFFDQKLYAAVNRKKGSAQLLEKMAAMLTEKSKK